ncbi:oxidoreductase [Halosegnis rubeus]|jgi:cytochrome-b5 reductase|uniref:Oxidoreductase n=1 Tax=Halosegnis rubeus TaxID=2212850 RepID=A0A5N5UIM1_9EURY|nr:FAD-binding oxidoreductase [Halosegnis rubeus]KAB7512638.1 oxidoreductase [Halosegnis rubeus]KAB7515534.1 oxidoreductase [Halosegnis rubeus]KAB7518564.1 oxidoreductase [Halosegnis rubeus]
MEPTETTVRAVRDVGPDTVAIDLDTPADFEGTPGQFVKLSTIIDGEQEARFYTISSPDTDETFELTVGYDPEDGGDFSEYLLSLDAGNAVTVTGPFGSDFYEGESASLVLAGGPGVGPAVGIAEAAVRDENDVTVVYLDDEPVHTERLDALAGDAEIHVVDDEDGFRDAVGAAFDDQQLFVYGFTDFLDLAEETIEDSGGSFEGAKVENFG